MDKRRYLNISILVLVVLVVIMIGIIVYWHLWTASQPQIPILQPIATSTVSQNLTSTITSSTSILAGSSTHATDTGVIANNSIPPSCIFSANPAVIVIPETTHLVWACKNVNICSITSNQENKFPNQNSSGTLSVSPSTLPITYTLTCGGTSGAVSSNTVNVTPAGHYGGDYGQP